MPGLNSFGLGVPGSITQSHLLPSLPEVCKVIDPVLHIDLDFLCVRSLDLMLCCAIEGCPDDIEQFLRLDLVHV